MALRQKINVTMSHGAPSLGNVGHQTTPPKSRDGHGRHVDTRDAIQVRGTAVSKKRHLRRANTAANFQEGCRVRQLRQLVDEIVTVGVRRRIPVGVELSIKDVPLTQKDAAPVPAPMYGSHGTKKGSIFTASL